MYALFGYIESEGMVFLGIFESVELAKKAKKFAKKEAYSYKEYIIEEVILNRVANGFGLDDLFNIKYL